MAYDNPRPPVKKNALDNRKLCLFAPAPNSTSNGQAILMWNVFGNNPRVTVFTGDPKDVSEGNNKGRISANLDAPVFFTFIEMMERVARSKVPIELKVLNRNYSWENGKRSDEPSVVSELRVCKDSDGSVWLSVEAEKRPKIKFFVVPSEWHLFCYGDGKPLDKTEVVTMHTLGYCHLLRNLVSGIMLTEYTEPVQRSTDQDNTRQDYTRNVKVEKEKPLPSLPKEWQDDIPF
jgi:hypothetical protein